MYTIEKNVPMPERKSKSRFPLAQMQVGDSFAIPPTDYNTARTICFNYCKKNTQVFKVIKRGEEIRVWRTA